MIRIIVARQMNSVYTVDSGEHFLLVVYAFL